MLSSDVAFIDIDPFQWGKLREIAALTGGNDRTAYVLYHQGEIAQIFIESRPNHGGALAANDRPRLQPQEIAGEIFAGHPAVNRVETYELAALQTYGRKISFDSDAMDSDVYFNYCRRLKNDAAGFKTFWRNPAAPQLDVFSFFRFLEEHNPQNYYCGIGLYQHNALYFSLIVGILGGKIKLISTFEYLQQYGLTAMPSFTEHAVFTQQFLERLRQDGEVIFLELDLVKDLSSSANKSGTLQRAIHDQKAWYNKPGSGIFAQFLKSC